MSATGWLGATVVVAAVVAALMLLRAAVTAHRDERRQRVARSGPIDSARAALVELRRRRETEAISESTFEDEHRVLVARLLDDTNVPSGPAQGRPSIIAGAGVLVALASGLVLLWSAHDTGDRSATKGSDASAPVSGTAAPTADGRSGGALTEEQLRRMVERQRERVKEAPGDAAAWAMLAHSYDMLGNFDESSKAYATLAALRPDDAQVLADYADALAVSQGRSLSGEPTALVERALRLDPRNVKALALAGTAAYERKAFAEAVALWERAVAAGPDDAFRRQLEDSITTARADLDGALAHASVGAKAASGIAGAAGAAIVSGRVTLAAGLVGQAAPDATVFIFARPAEGSRMPVALLKRQVRDLPVEFTLDDSSAMVPEAKLSSVDRIVIGARVSARGDVTPRPGDLQGWSAAVPVGKRDIRVEINEVMK